MVVMDSGLVASLRPGMTTEVVARYSPSTALLMMLRWISLEPP
jgi:hypothetical protein